MKAFTSHPVMLEDADLDYVTGGGLVIKNSANSNNQSNNQFSGDVSNDGVFGNNSGNTSGDGGEET
jgi:hypothetical protein